MAENDITDPLVAAKVSAIEEAAAKIEREALKAAFVDVLKTLKYSKDFSKVMIDREMRRSPGKIAKVNEQGIPVRKNKDGTEADLSLPGYWEKRWPDFKPRGKSTEGEVALELAQRAVGNLSLQMELVKLVGTSDASKLLALHGGDLAKVVEKPKPKGKDGSNTNPWLRDDEGAEAARIKVIQSSARLAESLAKSAGKRIDGRPLLPTGAAALEAEMAEAAATAAANKAAVAAARK